MNCIDPDGRYSAEREALYKEAKSWGVKTEVGGVRKLKRFLWAETYGKSDEDIRKEIRQKKIEVRRATIRGLKLLGLSYLSLIAPAPKPAPAPEPDSDPLAKGFEYMVKAEGVKLTLEFAGALDGDSSGAVKELTVAQAEEHITHYVKTHTKGQFKAGDCVPCSDHVKSLLISLRRTIPSLGIGDVEVRTYNVYVEGTFVGIHKAVVANIHDGYGNEETLLYDPVGLSGSEFAEAGKGHFGKESDADPAYITGEYESEVYPIQSK